MYYLILSGLEGQTQVLSLKNIELIETSLKYSFKNKSLLIQSLVHSSYHYENQSNIQFDNERLEFLGDAVLGLVITEILFSKKNILSESEMSKMRSYLVNKSILFEISEKLFLRDYILIGKGEEVTGGRQKKSILSNVAEALFGAIFLDSDYSTVKKVILDIYKDKIQNVILKKEGYDFKTMLQEKSQALFGVLPEYKIIKQEGVMNKRIFIFEVYIKNILYGKGSGESKKEAHISSAKEALGKLGFIYLSQ